MTESDRAARDSAAAPDRKRIEMLLQQGRYADVLAVADAAILEMLHQGVSVQDFIRLSLQGAAIESLIRIERRAVERFRHLHEPIALRWEVLRRWGKRDEASQMRLLCIRHFPRRASVWATAGNQALDEQSYDQAESYFEQCLRCNPRWTAGLSGLAIVCETRKDWPRALEYRRQVAENESALEKDDPPSLQRVMRYAAALARTGGWVQAGVLMRRCIERGSVEHLPAERPVLVRAFSRELYAPAIIAALPIPVDEITPEIARARREAQVLAQAAQSIFEDVSLDATARLKQLGICAWLAGDDARAYAFLDEAEVDAPDDSTIHCLLAWAAEAIDAEDRIHVEHFALAQARACVARATRESVPDIDRCCAAVTLARLDERGASLAALQGAVPTAQSLLASCVEALATPLDAPLPILPHVPGEDLYARLQRVMVFRGAHRAAGRLALEVALASAAALDPRAITPDP